MKKRHGKVDMLRREGIGGDEVLLKGNLEGNSCLSIDKRGC